MKLTEEARKLRNEYHRKYRATHKEKMKEAQIDYWNKKAESLANTNIETLSNEKKEN